MHRGYYSQQGYGLVVTTQVGEHVDGRSERRERGRVAVLDAVIDLIEEQGALPATAAIADRAGVSPASLFRYFDSIDDMQHEATLHHFYRNRDLFEIPDIGVGTLAERIDRLATCRVSLHAKTAPVARFGRTRVLEVPYVADGIRTVRRMNTKQNRDHFAGELESMGPERAEITVAAISALTSFESWDQLTRDFGHNNKFIEKCWVEALTKLLGD